MKNENKYPTPNSLEHNRQTLRLLFSWDQYQDKEIFFRRKHNIPLEGFGNESEHKKWLENMDDKEEKAIRNNKPFLPWEIFFTDLSEILSNFNLPENFKNDVKCHLLTGDLRFSPASFSFSFEPGFSPKREVDNISVNIYQRLTEDDFNEIKREIKWLCDRHFPSRGIDKARENSSLDRDIAMEKRLNEIKKKIKETDSTYLQEVKENHGVSKYNEVKKMQRHDEVEELEKFTYRDIALEFYDDIEKATNVRTALNELEKKRKERFK